LKSLFNNNSTYGFKDPSSVKVVQTNR